MHVRLGESQFLHLSTMCPQAGDTMVPISYLSIKWNNVYDVPSSDLGTQQTVLAAIGLGPWHLQTCPGHVLLLSFLFRSADVYHNTDANTEEGTTVLWRQSWGAEKEYELRNQAQALTSGFCHWLLGFGLGKLLNFSVCQFDHLWKRRKITSPSRYVKCPARWVPSQWCPSLLSEY